MAAYAVTGTVTYTVKANPTKSWNIGTTYNNNWNDYNEASASGTGPKSGTMSFATSSPWVTLWANNLGPQLSFQITGDYSITYTDFEYIPNPYEDQQYSENRVGGVWQRTWAHLVYWGGSINLATGAEEFNRQLLTVQGVRVLDFSISYSSLFSSSTAGRSTLGLGMGHSFEGGAFVDSADLATVRVGTSTVMFQKDSLGAWNCVTGFALHVSFGKRTDGTMWLASGDGRKVEFAADGTITSDSDSSGNLINYSYSSGKLSQVTDAETGKYLTFTYDSNGRLTQVQDNAGRIVTFTYSGTAPNFTKITDARGKFSSFGFGADGKLTWENDTGGSRITTNYFSGERVYLQYDARNHTLGYSLTQVTGGYQGVLTDRNGRTHTYTFNEKRLMTSYKDPMNRTTTWTINSAGQITRVTYPSGRYQDYTYSAEGDITNAATPTYAAASTFATIGGVTTGLPATITEPGSRTTTITRDSAARPTHIAAPDGYYSDYAYNANGQATTITGSDGSSVVMSYSGKLPSSVTTNGVTTIGIGLDAAGRLQSLTLPGSKTYSRTLDGNNNVLTLTGPGSRTVTTVYDGRSRPTKVTQPDGTFTSFGWDGNHNMTSMVDAMNCTTTCVYDNEDRLMSVTMPGSRTITYARDYSGLVTSVTSPAGRVTSFTYDADGNVLTTTSPNGTVTSATYDTAGLVASLINENSKTTTLTHNAAGQVETLTTPQSRVSSYAYDTLGRLLTSTLPSTKSASVSYNDSTRTRAVTDTGASAMSFVADTSGLLETFTTNLGRQTSFSYWEDNLIDRVTSPSGHTTDYDYDTYRALSSIVTGDGTTTFARDTMGRVTGTTEGTHTVGRAYDALGRLTSYTDSSGRVISYLYNTAGFLQRLTYPDSTYVTYTYDADGGLTGVTDWASRVTTIARDTMGRISSITYPNGAKQEYTYAPTGQIATIVSKASGGTAFLSRTISYSDDGFITGDTGAPAPSAIPSDTTLTFDSDHRALTFNGSSLVFDLDGNLTTGPTGSSPPYSIGPLTYDYRNRLTSAGGVSSFYDPEGRRTSITDSTGTTTFVYDPIEPLDRVLARIAPGSTTTKFVYGADAGLLYEATGTAIKAYHYDDRGSTVALTDNTGAVSDTFAYGPYGENFGRTGSSQTPFLYNAKYGVQTDENGLLSMRSRFYSPALKRFINEDSYLGSPEEPLTLNRYTFANGDPIRLSDPFGFMASDAHVGTRILGGIQFLGGAAGFSGTGILAARTPGKSKLLLGGCALLAADQAQAGYRTMLSGEQTESFLNIGLQAAGLTAQQAVVLEIAANLGSDAAALVLQRALQAGTRAVAEKIGSIPSLQGRVPNPAKFIENGGSVTYHVDGAATYSLADGTAVRYNNLGFPDFSPYLIRALPEKVRLASC